MPDQTYPSDAWRLLAPRLSPRRRERLERAAAHRTNWVRLVVQDIHHPHNVSACLRSAEAFGVLGVDVVTLKEAFSPSTVARGVADWLRVDRHQEVEGCVQHLRAKGYKIAAGVPVQDALPLPELPVDQPIAVVFGNEHAGIAPDWLSHIDYRFTIPMVGLVESLNISVSAALTLYELTQRAQRTVSREDYFLSESMRLDLLNEWIYKQLKSAEAELKILRQTT